jgi:hypothetical protein
MRKGHLEFGTLFSYYFLSPNVLSALYKILIGHERKYRPPIEPPPPLYLSPPLRPYKAKKRKMGVNGIFVKQFFPK